MPPEYYSPLDLMNLLPEVVLVVAGCAVLLMSQAGAETVRRAAPWVALWSIIVAAGIVVFGGGDRGSIGGGLDHDDLANYVRISTLILGFMFVLANWTQAQSSERGEYLAMLMFSLTGVMLVGPADDFVTLFLALELVSIPTYVMIALSRTRLVATEAATKYFYLGALSAAVMAYGLAFLYGVSGTTQISGSVAAVTEALANPGTLSYAIASLGVLLTFVGLLFKIAAVPMHWYIADVYQGAASPVAGVLGFVPKFAGMIAIFKIVALSGWVTLSGEMFWLLWWVAAITMTVGNLLALQQTNVKRMLGLFGHRPLRLYAGRRARRATWRRGLLRRRDGGGAVLRGGLRHRQPGRVLRARAAAQPGPGVRDAA